MLTTSLSAKNFECFKAVAVGLSYSIHTTLSRRFLSWYRWGKLCTKCEGAVDFQNFVALTRKFCIYCGTPFTARNGLQERESILSTYCCIFCYFLLNFQCWIQYGNPANYRGKLGTKITFSPVPDLTFLIFCSFFFWKVAILSCVSWSLTMKSRKPFARNCWFGFNLNYSDEIKSKDFSQKPNYQKKSRTG